MNLLKKQAHNANMSLIIGLKCVDGIILGSDRRINLYRNNKFIGSRESTKVFKGNNFIVGFYNSFSYLRKNNTIVNLEEVVKLIVEQAPNYKVFLDLFLSLFSNQHDNYIYEFLLGYFDSCEYQLEHYVLNRKKLRKKLIRDYFINSIDCGTNFLTTEKELKKDRSKEIVKRIIETTTFIQDELIIYLMLLTELTLLNFKHKHIGTLHMRIHIRIRKISKNKKGLFCPFKFI